MPRTSETRAGFLLAFASAGAFGVLPIFGKLAFAEGFEVPTLLAWRFSLGALLLWVLLLADGRRRAMAAGRRFALLALGAIYGLNSGLYFLALERIPATTTSLVFYVYPAIVAVLGIVFLKRRVRPLELAALGLALVGVALTIGFARGALDPAGVALALASAAIVAIYFVLGEIALAGVPTLHATALVLTGTFLVYLAWEAAMGGPGLPPGARAWLLVGLMATVSTAFSILALQGSIRRIGAGTVSIVSTLEPAFTVVVAAVVLHESLAPRQYAGGALILAGVVLLRIASRAPSPALADA